MEVPDWPCKYYWQLLAALSTMDTMTSDLPGGADGERGDAMIA